MDLFHYNYQNVDQPLAERLRPQSFSELVGQEDFFLKNSALIQRLKQGNLQSLILWGPPGCGKTSFANALIREVQAEVFQENAIDLGSKRIREIGEASKKNLLERNTKTIVMIDEIHRLNRGQQDVLLPFVERGYFYLVGATTENPSYQLNSALMSRCRLLVLEPLSEDHLKQLLNKALESAKLTAAELFDSASLQLFIAGSHGDGRKLINATEELIGNYRIENKEIPFPLTPEGLNTFFKSSGMRFDKSGNEHYNTISVFIKSIRGSDPDAAIYYLARMLEGGEDPVFIARRLVILASEDVGNADPQALTLAVSALQAVELVGMPEARINLAQAVTYLACAPKSNRAYLAIGRALAEVKKSGPLPIPKPFQSSPSKEMEAQGYGVEYQYTHDAEKAWMPQDYFPEALKERSFYVPSERGFEKRIKEFLAWLKSDGKNSGSKN